jgi:hypothetical protein
VVKKCLAKRSVMALGHPPYLLLRNVANAKNITAKVTKALTEVQKNSFQEFFQKLYKRWQNCPRELL